MEIIDAQHPEILSGNIIIHSFGKDLNRDRASEGEA